MCVISRVNLEMEICKVVFPQIHIKPPFDNIFYGIFLCRQTTHFQHKCSFYSEDTR